MWTPSPSRKSNKKKEKQSVFCLEQSTACRSWRVIWSVWTILSSPEIFQRNCSQRLICYHISDICLLLNSNRLLSVCKQRQKVLVRVTKSDSAGKWGQFLTESFGVSWLFEVQGDTVQKQKIQPGQTSGQCRHDSPNDSNACFWLWEETWVRRESPRRLVSIQTPHRKGPVISVKH